MRPRSRESSRIGCSGCDGCCACRLLARIPGRGAWRLERSTASVRSAAVKVGPSGCPPGTADAALLTAAPLPLCGDEVRLGPDWASSPKPLLPQTPGAPFPTALSCGATVADSSQRVGPAAGVTFQRLAGRPAVSILVLVALPLAARVWSAWSSSSAGWLRCRRWLSWVRVSPLGDLLSAAWICSASGSPVASPSAHLPRSCSKTENLGLNEPRPGLAGARKRPPEQG
jgi:hypothetical protein